MLPDRSSTRRSGKPFSSGTMKEYLFILLACFILSAAGLINSCSKSKTDPPVVNGTKVSFTEEFDTVMNLAQPSKGWVLKNNTGPTLGASWAQGQTNAMDKSGNVYGFPAFSYHNSTDEFAYANMIYASGTNVSSWLITPVLSVKNGDKISFYTRADLCVSCKDRLQVLINKSGSDDVGTSPGSVGGYTTVLLDINPNHTAAGYPSAWTLYEYTFSGLSGTINTRVAFRYYVPGPLPGKGVGIDLFKFTVL